MSEIGRTDTNSRPRSSIASKPHKLITPMFFMLDEADLNLASQPDSTPNSMKSEQRKLSQSAAGQGSSGFVSLEGL